MEAIDTFIEYTGIALEALGVVVIALGALYATVRAFRGYFGSEIRSAVYRRYRHQLGRSILLGLELLVAGDIINSVAVEPSFSSVGVLAVIVLIRTFLSFTLEVEMTGKWPWKGGTEEVEPAEEKQAGESR